MGKDTTIYQYFRRTIAAGQFIPIYAYSRFITLLNNTITTYPEISINGQPFQEMPVGLSVELPESDKFKYLQFRNPAAVSCTIRFALSSGIIHDNRLIQINDFNVIDVADVVVSAIPVVALDRRYLIDNAAAVDKGGGLVGIPVTSNPYATGETIVIENTVNYNSIYTVDATSSANEVVITETFNAETFDGVDDDIGLVLPRQHIAYPNAKSIIIQNNGAVDVWVGGNGVRVSTKTGVKLIAGDIITMAVLGAIYCVSDTAGKTGAVVSFTIQYRVLV